MNLQAQKLGIFVCHCAVTCAKFETLNFVNFVLVVSQISLIAAAAAEINCIIISNPAVGCMTARQRACSRENCAVFV